ncbi:hypothetical protein Q4S20_21070, partial [Morganella morganii]
IVNVGTLVAGFDSDVRCIIYARPTKSEIRWVQCLGRGLRNNRSALSCAKFGVIVNMPLPQFYRPGSTAK